MNFLEQLDQKLFILINKMSVNDFFDFLLPIIRMKYVWAPMYLFIIVYLIVQHKKKGLWAILFLLICFAASDYISGTLIKQSVERLRPCNDLSFMANVRNLVGCGSGYSFVSSHASNHMAMATFLSALWPQQRVLGYALFVWAISIAYAQVYVGVHYPFDVIVGAILGYNIARITFYFFNRKIKFNEA